MTDLETLTAALAGRYAIEREIGAGGMATVYLARDLKHDRQVALKVLRPELSAILGGDRFLAEIKTTANLQHPHILGLFDSGEAGGMVFYVMPYVDGESLRDRLNREKQLPVDEAVRIAREVADALDYAHQHGVVHRDIKPENILLHGGHAMVADFGIALAASRTEGGGRMTETGMSLGTPHYMAPEQAMGQREITPKADIYALGCVLYEMLTAEPPFVGATPQAIIARVMMEEPRSLTMQRKSIPPHVEAAVRTAIEKIPSDRFATAREFAEALGKVDYVQPGAKAAGSGAVAMVRSPGAGRALRALPWALFVAAGSVALFFALRSSPPRVSRHRFELWPNGARPGAVAFGLAISPDGNTIVFADSAGGKRQLWSKERDKLEATPLTGTVGAGGPVFSPDGEWIAFVTDGKLKKVPLAGGSALTVADSANADLPAIAWLDDGTIAFNNSGYGLAVVGQDGGPLRRVFRTDSLKGGAVTATALPGGRGVLVGVCQPGCPTVRLTAIDLKSGKSALVADEAYKGWYTAGGQVVFARKDGGVFAGAFDLDKVAFKGAPSPVFDGVQVVSGSADMAIGANGTLIYALGGAVDLLKVEVVWVTRQGAVTLVDSSWSFMPSGNVGVALSPDGQRVAVSVRSGLNGDIWIKELGGGRQFTRLTFEGTNNRPAWAADGRTVYYVSIHTGGNDDIRARRADGAGAEVTLLDLPRRVMQLEPTHDTTRFIVRLAGPPSNDIKLGTVGSDSAAALVADAKFSEVGPALSPDGRWLAYASNESGRYEVYVRPFPNVNAGRWPVSAGGGKEPQWSHSGRELFYRDSASLMAAQVKPGAVFAIAGQQRLFGTAAFRAEDAHHLYAIAPGDNRFLFLRRVGAQVEAKPAPLVLVENWFEELKQRMAKK